MIITDTAIVIPICGKHYHYMYALIEKLKKNDIKIDMYLIFSNEHDYNEFKYKDDINKIIVNDISSLNCTKNIVTFKKLYALNQLINKEYDYFIVCDAEIDIIPENFISNNITDKIRSMFDNKKIYGGISGRDYIYRINKFSSNLFSQDEQNIIKDKTNNFRVFFWWSDIPVYKRAHLEDYLQKINFNNINWSNIIWDHFDYIIYQYYLILTKGFEIIDYTHIINHGLSIEQLFIESTEVMEKINNMQFGFSWMTKTLFNRNKEYLLKKKTFMIYHLDRLY